MGEGDSTSGHLPATARLTVADRLIGPPGDWAPVARAGPGAPPELRGRRVTEVQAADVFAPYVFALDVFSGLAKLRGADNMTDGDQAKYEAQAEVHKALAHPTRLFIVAQLSRRERCVCELTAMIGVEMPTVSRHLSVLKRAGIVEDDKRGTQVFYRLKTPCVMKFFRCVSDVRQAAIRRGAALTG